MNLSPQAATGDRATGELFPKGKGRSENTDTERKEKVGATSDAIKMCPIFEAVKIFAVCTNRIVVRPLSFFTFIFVILHRTQLSHSSANLLLFFLDMISFLSQRKRHGRNPDPTPK